MNLRACTQELRARFDAHERALGLDPRAVARADLEAAARAAARLWLEGADPSRELARVLAAAARLDALEG